MLCVEVGHFDKLNERCWDASIGCYKYILILYPQFLFFSVLFNKHFSSLPVLHLLSIKKLIITRRRIFYEMALVGLRFNFNWFFCPG